MGLERSSGVVPTGRVSQPGNGEELARSVKPFGIAKRVVWDAYKHVKAHQGAEGIDRQTIEMFEANLKGNLYLIWNRMCSGSYFPPPVRLVEIPKKNGGVRTLGIPTSNSNYTLKQYALGMGTDLPPVPSAKRPEIHGFEDPSVVGPRDVAAARTDPGQHQCAAGVDGLGRPDGVVTALNTPVAICVGAFARARATGTKFAEA